MEAAGVAGEASAWEAVVIRPGRSETKDGGQGGQPGHDEEERGETCRFHGGAEQVVEGMAHVEQERGRADSGHVASRVR